VQGTNLRNVMLPPYFRVEFNMTVAALAASPGVRFNLFDLVNIYTGQSLLSLYLTNTVDTQIKFNGVVLSNNSVRFRADYTNPTYIRVHVYVDQVRAVASSDMSWVPVYPVTNNRLTNDVYSLYISNPIDYSGGGSITKVRFAGKLFDA